MNSRLSASLLTVAASVALPLFTGLPASAVTVRIGTIDYDVTVFTGSYDNNNSLFQAPPLGQMPWWGDVTGDLALLFAQQVYDQLGDGPTSGFGPVFAYDLDMGDVLGISQSLTNPLSQLDETLAPSDSVAYAIARPLLPPSTPVPGPLPVFGAMAAFGWSRRIRRRIGGTPH
ncbi:hypothetical protein H6G65_19100 [Microcystis elabens FACHB-917]|nr:hypothetical protein [Microcystis elabens FACHB-917]